MKKALCLVAVLAMAAGAYAVDGRIFLTTSSEGYGLTEPANACTPTLSEVDLDGNNYNAYDYYYGHFVVDAFPPADHDGSSVMIDPGDFAYIWLQFDAAMPKNLKINGMVITVTDGGGAEVAGATPVYYLQNDMQGFGVKRWDGPATAPDYPEFVGNNPQVLVAVTAQGIQKKGIDDLVNMYTGNTGGNIALLGALCADDLDAIPGTYNIDITDINYAEGEVGEWTGATFTVTPEPASLLLLGLAGLVLRRR